MSNYVLHSTMDCDDPALLELLRGPVTSLLMCRPSPSLESLDNVLRVVRLGRMSRVDENDPVSPAVFLMTLRGVRTADLAWRLGYPEGAERKIVTAEDVPFVEAVVGIASTSLKLP